MSPPLPTSLSCSGRSSISIAAWPSFPVCEEVNTELAVSVLEEAGKFASGVLEPLNRPGDEEGCRLVDGAVATPKGMAEAYRAFAEAGWCSLSGDPEYGGRGLPRVLQLMLDEFLCSAPCPSACSPASAVAPSRRSRAMPARS
jgi:alkylation response protein AidB-like acyl-CoA dehydrogenase